MRKSLSSIVCLSGTFACGFANAETVYFQQGLDNAYVTNYQGTSDTAFNSASNGVNPGYNNGNMGGSDFLMSNQTRTWEENRSLFRFDLSVLTGQGLNVDSATLILRPVTGGSPDNINVFLHTISSANAGWQQGTNPSIVANASPGSATWNEKVYQTTPWAGSPGLSTPGVDYDPTAVATGVYDPGSTADTSFTLPSALVQSWINAPAQNAGLMLLTDNDSTNGYNRFAEYFASEATNSSLRPTLALEVSQFVNPTWVGDRGGDWHASTNWSAGTIPNAVDAVAVFANAITAPRTVYADTPVTVGTMRFDSEFGYQIAGQASLSIDVSSGSGSIEVLQGTHKLNIPLFVMDNTTASISAGAVLMISDPMTLSSGSTLTKIGDGTLSIEAPVANAAPATVAATAGVVSASMDLGANTTVNVSGGTTQFSSTQHLAALNVSGGVAKVGPGTAVVVATKSLAISGSGQVNLQNGKMVVDYTGVSAYAGVKSAVNSGSLTSSQLGNGRVIAVGEASDLFAGATGNFAGETVDSSSVVIACTVNADANLDGTVNSSDFNTFVANYGQTADSRWTEGDFDGDGKINTIDFNTLAGNFGNSLPASAPRLGSVVPEPASLGLISLAGAFLARRRNRTMSH